MGILKESPASPPTLDPAAIVNTSRRLRGVATALRQIARDLRRDAGRLAGVPPKPESTADASKDTAS